MTELRKRMIECLQLRGLSERTQELDVRAVRPQAEPSRQSPDVRTAAERRQDVRDIQPVPHDSRRASTSARGGITFVCEHPLTRDGPTRRGVRAPREQKRPVIRSLAAVRRMRGGVRPPSDRRYDRPWPGIPGASEVVSRGSGCARPGPATGVTRLTCPPSLPAGDSPGRAPGGQHAPTSSSMASPAQQSFAPRAATTGTTPTCALTSMSPAGKKTGVGTVSQSAAARPPAALWPLLAGALPSARSTAARGRIATSRVRTKTRPRLRSPAVPSPPQRVYGGFSRTSCHADSSTSEMTACATRPTVLGSTGPDPGALPVLTTPRRRINLPVSNHRLSRPGAPTVDAS